MKEGTRQTLVTIHSQLAASVKAVSGFAKTPHFVLIARHLKGAAKAIEQVIGKPSGGRRE